MNPVMRRLIATELTHRAVPWPVARRAVTLLADRAWARDEQLREDARWQMRYLVGATDRAGELEELAHDHVREVYLRLESYWRPWQITRTPPRFTNELQQLRRARRPVIVSYLHQGTFTGHIAALCRVVTPLHVPVASGIADLDSSRGDSSYLRTHAVRTAHLIKGSGGVLFDAGGSKQRISELLHAGEMVAIAADIAGRNEISLLGRETRVAGGTSRLAFETGALVIPMTVGHDGKKEIATLEVGLDPKNFADAQGLLNQLMTVFERALLAWPQGSERPLRRWDMSEKDAREFGPALAATLKI